MEVQMHIYVNGRNIEITEAIKAYVKEKIGKVANHYDQIQGIEVVLSVIKKMHPKFLSKVEIGPCFNSPLYMLSACI